VIEFVKLMIRGRVGILTYPAVRSECVGPLSSAEQHKHRPEYLSSSGWKPGKKCRNGATFAPLAQMRKPYTGKAWIQFGIRTCKGVGNARFDRPGNMEAAVR